MQYTFAALCLKYLHDTHKLEDTGDVKDFTTYLFIPFEFCYQGCFIYLSEML